MGARAYMNLTPFWCPLCKQIRLHEDARARIVCCKNTVMVRARLVSDPRHMEINIQVEVDEEPCPTL